MSKLLELGQTLAQSQTQNELRQAFESGVDFLEASNYGITSFRTDDHVKTDDTICTSLHNMPSGYVESFFDKPSALVDPVMQHCRVSSKAVTWDHTTYRRVNQLSQWEHMAAYGLCQGICLAIHLGPKRHFCAGIEWDRMTNLSQEKQNEKAIALHILATFAEPAAYRILQAPKKEAGELEKALSAREAECLYWVGRGMTDQLIARFLKISARTVRKHVDNSVLKLSAANRTEAAVTATRLGLWVHGGVGS